MVHGEVPKIQRRFHAVHLVFVDGPEHPVNGGFPGGAMGAELGQHGVVVHAHFAAFLNAVVHANARTHGWAVPGQSPRARQEPTGHVLGVHAQFQGVSLNAQVFLAERQRMPFGDANLFTDQVDACHHFGDRMLDLQTRVHLQEVELPGCIDQKLHGSSPNVVARLGHFDGARAHFGTKCIVQEGRGGFLHHLLVAALDAALPFKQVNRIAVAVAQDLDFDVARLLNQALNEHGPVAKGTLRLTDGSCKFLFQHGRIMHRTHAFASSASTRLDQQGESDALGFPLGFCGVRNGTIGAWDHGDVSLGHGVFGGKLGTHDFNGMGLGPHETNPRPFHGLRENGIFAQEAITRVNGIGPRSFGRIQDALNHQITLAAGGWPHTDGLVRHSDKGCIDVGFAVHRDSRDAHLFGGAQHPHGNFSSVGDQQFADGADGGIRHGNRL